MPKPGRSSPPRAERKEIRNVQQVDLLSRKLSPDPVAQSCRSHRNAFDCHISGLLVIYEDSWGESSSWLREESRELPGDHDHQDLPKSTAIQMGGVCCNTNGRRTAIQMGGVLTIFPFFRAWGHQKYCHTIIQSGGILQYKLEVYCDTF